MCAKYVAPSYDRVIADAVSPSMRAVVSPSSGTIDNAVEFEIVSSVLMRIIRPSDDSIGGNAIVNVPFPPDHVTNKM